VKKLEISDIDELEFDLSNIGVEITFLVIEHDKNYIYNDNFYIEFSKNLFESKQGELVLIDEDDNQLKITSEQLEEIKKILVSDF
jgi:hypothetical protein